MGLRSTIGAATLLLSTAYAADAPQGNYLTLLPVAAVKIGGVKTAGRHMVPKKELSLQWQTPKADSAVTVGLSMQNTAVNLEDVDDISGVDCVGQNSVHVTFNNTEAFQEAVTAWSGLNDSFVMITNHLGDCDEELERSFFVADTDTFASYENNLTVVLQAEKSDVVSTTTSTSIDFNSIAPAKGASDLAERSLVTWTEDGMTFAYNYSMPENQDIIDTDYVKVTLNDIYVNNSVTYSGHAKWDLFKGVTEFYIDVEKSVDHFADIDMMVKGPFGSSIKWAPSFLNYALIHIPGIISLGPAAGISIGAAVATQVAVDVSATFQSAMPNGQIHIDFVNWDSSYSTGWETTHDSNFNITENITFGFRPFMDFTVEFAVKLFGGLIDLSSGVKAEPSFPFVTTAGLTQSLSNHNWTNVAYPNSTATYSCANGLKEEISFQFDIIAFATKWVNINLYEYKTDISTSCLNWFNKH